MVDHGSMSMVIDMNDEKLKTLEQIKEFMAETDNLHEDLSDSVISRPLVPEIWAFTTGTRGFSRV